MYSSTSHALIGVLMGLLSVSKEPLFLSMYTCYSSSSSQLGWCAFAQPLLGLC